ncbi:MAG: hypothetical protein AAF462_02405 [Thermodesulfobacteriota bacterium]
MRRKTVLVNLSVQIPEGLRNLSRTFSQILLKINTLYDLQSGGTLTPRDERKIWKEIPALLSSTSTDIEVLLDRDIQNLEKGIFDLYPVSITLNNYEIDLIIGKIFVSEGASSSYYAGVAGIINEKYKTVLNSYDSKLELLCQELGCLSANKTESIVDKAPKIKCLEVFSLSGALDIEHKPICIFYSGDSPENLSALSNMTVFINLYSERFKAITMQIVKKYVQGAELLDELSDSEISDLLLVWLRGHDVGHFIGEDKLGQKMTEFDRDYMILHELKSDLIALYSFRLYRNDLLDKGLLEKIYFLTVAEMLRYIRRGDITNHPDSASAYIAWRYFEDSGAIKYNANSNKFLIDINILEQSLSKITHELLSIFASGDEVAARKLTHRYGSLENNGSNDKFPVDCSIELGNALRDMNLPYYIDYKFITD